MFVLMAGIGLAVALGLLRLHKWARWIAILAAMVLLLPGVSSALIDSRFGKLAWDGLGVIVRAMIVWYLFQEPVNEAFESKALI
jgi:hypothetical protein